jgi:hypothetical protein
MLGISYQGRYKDEEYREIFSSKGEMKKVMKVALRNGIKLFAASTHDFNELSPTHLEAIEEIENEENTEVSLIVCISVPLEFRGKKIDDYRRWKTHLMYETMEFGKKVRQRFVEDPILNCHPKWKEELNSAKQYDLKELKMELKIDWDVLKARVEEFVDRRIAWIEPGSETDFLAISRIELMEELLDRIRELGYRALLGSHHFGATFPLIEERQVRGFDGYVTPVNNLGAMMFPDQIIVEDAIRRAREVGRSIIGIKPFAGGRIKPEKALNYIYKTIKADSCMIGVGSVEEAEKDFQIAKDILDNI